MKPAVLVLSTLHQYHAQVLCYSFTALRGLLTALEPDLLMAEVTEDDLRVRADEAIKREYPEVVYPFLDASPRVNVRALEPMGEVGDALIRRVRTARDALES